MKMTLEEGKKILKTFTIFLRDNLIFFQYIKIIFQYIKNYKKLCNTAKTKRFFISPCILRLLS